MTSELTKAHCLFLKQIGKIEETETNPFHKSQYASLEGILAVVNPVLAANNLSVHQIFSSDENSRTVLKTILRHESGEELVSNALFPHTQGKNPLHDWVSNVTYMRRYTLLSILGICAGIEDNDGNEASELPAVSTPSSVITTKPQRVAPKKLSKVEKENGINFVKAWAKENPEGFEKLKVAYGMAFRDFNDMEKPSFNLHVLFPMHLEFIKEFIQSYV